MTRRRLGDVDPRERTHRPPRYILSQKAFAAAVAIALEHGWDLADAHHQGWAKEHGVRCPSMQMKPETIALHLQRTCAYIIAEIRKDMARTDRPRLVLPAGSVH